MRKDGFKDPAEFEHRFFIKRDRIEHVARSQTRLGQAIPDGVDGKAGVMFLASETLLLRGGHNPAVLHQAGGGIVIVGANSDNIHQDCSW